MKTKALFFLAISAYSQSFAQNFSDNFESYTVGAYLGPQSAEWTTFSGFGQGSSEDVLITNLVASSGTKSILFSSNELGGGPQDVVLDFQNTHTSGIFTFQSKFYVLPGKKASFGFQKEATLGNGFAIEALLEGGNILIQNLGSSMITVAYPEGTWFTVQIIANLSTTIWEVKINGVSAGQWINPTNSLHYLNIYPVEGAQFLMDDVAYSHVPYSSLNLNASAANLVLNGSIIGENATPKFTVLNTGTTVINSFDASFSYNGQNYTENVTGLNLAPMSFSEILFPSTTLVAGVNNAIAKIVNVNGITDNDTTDNFSSRIVDPVVPAVGKMVVSEKATATWCEWCPRGTVAMENFQQKYSNYWVGIAIHRNDPMMYAPYNTGFAAVGTPTAKVDRKGVFVDPSQMTLPFYSRLQVAPKAFVEVGATYNNVSRELKVSGNFNFQSAATNGYKVAFVITEDGVTGTTSNYAQANAYAGGTFGAMGGFELLSNPVPATQISYDHVARIIAPSYGGYAQSFPATVASGSSHAVNHTFVLPTNWNKDSLHIIALLIAPNGEIDNAGKATVEEAVINGYVNGVSTTVEVAEIEAIDASFNVFPNPASSFANIILHLKTASDIKIKVVDLSGKVIADRSYENMNGASTIQLNTSGFSQGMYTVEAYIAGEKLTRKLVIQ